jgi:hypothetical protein
LVKCPRCDCTMRAGRANVETWISGFGAADLFVRRPGLYFYPDGGGAEAVSLGRSLRTFLCPRCHTLLFPGGEQRAEEQTAETGPEADPTRCPACGASIAAEDVRCPGCQIGF